jgi:hypothetical protein
MIWYRHWLEIRPALIVVIVLAFGMAGLFAYQIGEGPLSRELATSHLVGLFDRPAVLSWAMYANRVGVSAWIVALILGSTGLRSLSLSSPIGSLAFTLTLPVSRRRLIATRLATTVAVGLGFEALWLITHVSILELRGLQVPYGPLFQSFAFAVPVSIAWISVLSALMTFLTKLWGFLTAIVLAIAGAIPVQRLVTLWPLRGEFPWLELGGVLTIAAVALALTLRFGPEQEYA